jgi:pyrroloquinoline-quinone synthase
VRFDSLLDQHRRDVHLDERPFFSALARTSDEPGAFLRDDFVETQAQFLFAVVYFARPMRVLSARLEAGPARTSLLENIRDEAGGGDRSASHEATFLELLARLGLSRGEVEKRALWPETRAFDDALAGLAVSGHPLTALAAFGMIEDCFATISARIGQAIVARGWLAADHVVHYAVHEELDHVHAAGFFEAVRPACETEEGAYLVDQGLGLGAYLLLRLFDDLYAARARRRFRTASGPHGGGIGLDQTDDELSQNV